MIELTQKIFNIVILEDNAFYNKMIKAQLDRCIERLKATQNVNFTLTAFTHSEDFLLNLNSDIDVAFIDYFLGSGVTGNTIIPKLKQENPNCQVAIMSLHENAEDRLKGITEDISTFIPKDRKALNEICKFVQVMLEKKYPLIP